MDGVKAVRGLIIAAALAAGIASPVLACSLIFPELPDGLSETEVQAAYSRWFYEADLARQKKRWDDADYVFLAEVRSMRLVGENLVAADIRPIVSIKGNVGSGVIQDTYEPDFGSTCGPARYPGIGERAIFYGRKLSWWERLLNWGRPQITSVSILREVLNPRVPTELRAAAARLRKQEPK